MTLETTVLSLLVALVVASSACHTPPRERSDPTHRDDRADEAAIRALLAEHYLRGMDTLSFDDFSPAFHPAARLAFVAGGELVRLDLDQWRERLASLRADANHPLHRERSEKHVDEVVIAGDAAAAIVRFVFPSRTYTDFLQLVRVGGQWKIIAKTFHLELTS